MTLHRFWIEFQLLPQQHVGYGVTAIDFADALKLLADTLDTQLPAPTRVVHDVDVRTLDEGHVLPNMLPPDSRGIWFPMLRPLP